jgi:hypothetical protein
MAWPWEYEWVVKVLWWAVKWAVGMDEKKAELKADLKVVLKETHWVYWLE